MIKQVTFVILKHNYEPGTQCFYNDVFRQVAAGVQETLLSIDVISVDRATQKEVRCNN